MSAEYLLIASILECQFCRTDPRKIWFKDRYGRETRYASLTEISSLILIFQEIFNANFLAQATDDRAD